MSSTKLHEFKNIDPVLPGENIWSGLRPEQTLYVIVLHTINDS